MANWIKVCDEKDFTEPIMVYEYEDNPIAIFKLDDGYYAIDNTCSHEKASLAEGEIEGHTIECPVHGALFDIKTGRNLSLPAVLPVESYEVKVEENIIYLNIGE
jgi:3-phenylpropionate/trans-cinnamate dioxygenase ferredoxin subunit